MASARSDAIRNIISLIDYLGIKPEISKVLIKDKLNPTTNNITANNITADNIGHQVSLNQGTPVDRTIQTSQKAIS